MPKEVTKTKRTEVKRLKERANYDEALIFKAIDEAIIGTVAFLPQFQVCVSITNVHGLVLARSAFYHSINYTCCQRPGTHRFAT